LRECKRKKNKSSWEKEAKETNLEKERERNEEDEWTDSTIRTFQDGLPRRRQRSEFTELTADRVLSHLGKNFILSAELAPLKLTSPTIFRKGEILIII
jgi:hypothetical protein